MSGDAGGRPPKYSEETAEQAKKLCDLGATDDDLANFFMVTRRTINRWKIEHPEFCHALKLGKDGPDNRVKRSLYHRAIGYSHPDVHISNYKGEITVTKITRHHPPDTVACIFWLKNRCPDEFRQNPDGDGPLNDLAEALRDISERLPG